MIKTADQVDLTPEQGWIAFDASRWQERHRGYVSGEPEGRRLRVQYFLRDSDKALVGKAWFGPGTQGPPGHAHGGSMAALLDEVMGAAAWMAGHQVLAAGIKVDFRAMLPLLTVVRLEGLVMEVNGRKVSMQGRLMDEAGKVFAESEGTFLKFTRRQFDGFGRAAGERGGPPAPKPES